jgi:osmotically-inducible protein OsmY
MRKLSLIAAIFFCCCMLHAADARGSAGTAQARPRVSDAELESKIHTKLAKSKIGKDGFTVKVKGGVVTWEGKTNVVQHKGAATRMARTAGAVEVVNNIKIGDEARKKRVEVKPEP